MQNRLMELVEKTTLKPTTPKFEIGDTVDVHVRILEGDKERIQIYNGVVIARSGPGPREMFTCQAHRAGRGGRAEVSPSVPADHRHRREAIGQGPHAPSSIISAVAPARLSASRSASAARPAPEAKAAKAERRKARAAKKEKDKASS